MFVGVIPEEIFAKVGSTFTISCSVEKANGKLNFYEGDDLVLDEHIKVCFFLISFSMVTFFTLNFFRE
jgi:hypothetical protein